MQHYRLTIKEMQSTLKVNLSFFSLFQGPAPGLPALVCMGLPALVQLNCVHTGVVRIQLSMLKWGPAPMLICECGALDQIEAHVILDCPLHCASKRYYGMLNLDVETRCWLKNIVTISKENFLPQEEKQLKTLLPYLKRISFHKKKNS